MGRQDMGDPTTPCGVMGRKAPVSKDTYGRTDLT